MALAHYNYDQNETNKFGQVANVTISSAEVLALETTPIELVAAPGASKVIVVRQVVAKLDYAGTAYAAGAAIKFKYTDDSGAEVTTTGGIANTFLQATADDAFVAVGADVNATPNAAVVAAVTTTAYTTGTSPLQVRVLYDIIDITE